MSSSRLRTFGRTLKNQSHLSKATGSNSENEEWVDEEQARQRSRRGRGGQPPRAAPHTSAHKRRKGPTSTASRGATRDRSDDGAQIQATGTGAANGAFPTVRHAPGRILTSLDYALSLVADVVSGLYFAFDTTLRVLVPSMGFFRIPFAIVACPPALSTTIVLAILSLLTSILFHNVSILFTGLAAHLQSGLETACGVRVVSSMPICHWINIPPVTARGAERKDVVYWADYPSLMEVQSRTFEQVLDKSVTRSTTPSSLSLDLKKAEVATADLIVLIRLSSLRSRDSLGDTLGEFLSGARSAGRALARLDAKMNGALDNIMAMNNYVIRSIEEAKANELPVPRLLKTFTPHIFGKATDDVMKETFLDSMHVLSGHLEDIILEVEDNIHKLDLLEEKLNTLRSIIARDDAVVAAGREELLSYLWTKLGGNRKDLKNFDRNLRLLAELGRCRQAAQARVVGALHVLQRVSQDMEDMRDRVAAPNLAGSRVTPEVHMQSIANGMERLAWGRKRARRIEDELLRRTLDAPSPLDG